MLRHSVKHPEPTFPIKPNHRHLLFFDKSFFDNKKEQFAFDMVRWIGLVFSANMKNKM